MPIYNIIMNIKFIYVSFIIFISSSLCWSKTELILDDSDKIKNVNNPLLSPDGKWILYSLSTVNIDQDKNESQLWLSSTDENIHLPLTNPQNFKSVSKHTWSVDGKFITFLGNKDNPPGEDSKKGPQVYKINLLGGEAFAVTETPKGIDDYTFSPDGNKIALIIKDTDPESEPDKIKGWNKKTPRPIVIDRYRFKKDGEGHLTSYYNQIWLWDVKTKQSYRLTEHPSHHDEVVWTPDSKEIIYIRSDYQDPKDSTPYEDKNIYRINASPKTKPERLTDFYGPDMGPIVVSPNGLSIAYLEGDHPKYSAYSSAHLAVLNLKSKQKKILSTIIDRSIDSSSPIYWSKDSKEVFAVISDNRAKKLVQFSATNPDTYNIFLEKEFSTIGNASIDERESKISLIMGNASMPNEIFLYDIKQKAFKQITDHNSFWLKEKNIPQVEDFSSTSVDKNLTHGLIYYPPHYKKGKKYPLFLFIHGGPNAQDSYSFHITPHLIATEGFIVLRMNYRGSDGRGHEYKKSIHGIWGEKESLDLVGSIDEAIKQNLVDNEKIVVGGWSYGGILTNFLAEKDPRIKAGISGAGSGLNLTLYGHDEYIFQYDHELGYPWENLEKWLKVSSPFFNVPKIKAPILYLCAEKDVNVPCVGSEQMYQALKALDVPTGLIIFPNQNHGLTTPSYKKYLIEKYISWAKKHLNIK